MELWSGPSHVVHSQYDTVYLHDQEVQKEDMRRLYENAKRDQWNASTAIAWDTPVDLGAGVRSRRADRHLRTRPTGTR